MCQRNAAAAAICGIGRGTGTKGVVAQAIQPTRKSHQGTKAACRCMHAGAWRHALPHQVWAGAPALLALGALVACPQAGWPALLNGRVATQVILSILPLSNFAACRCHTRAAATGRGRTSSVKTAAAGRNCSRAAGFCCPVPSSQRHDDVAQSRGASVSYSMPSNTLTALLA